MQCLQGGSNPQTLNMESSILPLSHHTPQNVFVTRQRFLSAPFLQSIDYPRAYKNTPTPFLNWGGGGGLSKIWGLGILPWISPESLSEKDKQTALEVNVSKRINRAMTV